MSKVMELAKFKLKAGVSTDEFLKVSSEFVLNFVSAQDGFVQHNLCYNKEEGLWADCVVWNDFDSIERVSLAMQKSEVAGMYLSILDMESVVVEHWELH